MAFHKLGPFVGERFKHFKKMIPLSMTFFLYLFAWGLVAPIFNIRINTVTGSLLLSGIIFSLLGLIGILINPRVGILCDKYSPKKLLQATLLVYILIFILYAMAYDFWTMFIARIIHSIACSVLWIAGWTLVRKKALGKNAQEELSAWSSFQNIAYMIAPLIGGLIISLYDWVIVYYIGAVICLASYIYLTFRVSEPEPNHQCLSKSFKEQFSSFFKNKSSATRLVLLTLSLFMISSSFGSFLPILLQSSGVGITEISVIIGLSATAPYIMFPIIIGFISDKYGRKIPTLIGLLFMTVGFTLFTVLSGFNQFFLVTMLIYTGIVFIDMSTNAELNDLIIEGEVGSFTGFFETIKNVGVFIGPLLMGVVSQAVGLSQAFIMLAVISLSSTVVLKGFKNY